MSLIERMMTPCVMRMPTRVPDGQGGQTSSYVDGESFSAAVVKNSSFEARIAEQQTGKATYTITTARALAYHDTFKRLSDAVAFRVTSKSADSEPPAEASFSFRQVSAEVWQE